MKLNIIAISYAKRTLDPQSRERERMRRYADELGQYHIIVFTRKSEGFEARQQDGNLFLYATNASNKLAMLARAFSIGRHILANNKNVPCVISSQDPFESSLIGRMLVYGTKHIHQVQIHGDVFNPKSYRSSVLQWVRAQYGKRVVRSTAIIRVVSERIKRSLLKLGVSEDRIIVLPIHASLQKYIEVGTNRKYLEVNPLKLLFVGRLASEKNLTLLLHACALCKKQNVSFTLRIVGEGPEKSALEKLAVSLGIQLEVSFIPWQDSVVKEMAQADVFCLTSNHEGWAMVLQEAAAAGLAIITTDVGCAGELLQDQQSAVIVPVGDTSGYAQGLQSLQDNVLRKSIAQAAHERVSTTVIGQTEYVQQFVASHLSR